MRISDWSSDVCSSDLIALAGRGELLAHRVDVALGSEALAEVGEPAEERSHQAVLERYEQLLLAHRLDLVVVELAQRRSHHRSLLGLAEDGEIGRASGRERVCPDV